MVPVFEFLHKRASGFTSRLLFKQPVNKVPISKFKTLLARTRFLNKTVKASSRHDRVEQA